MKHVLFVCARNRLRSPTAEQVFADWPGVAVASAGLAPDADELLTGEQVEWADLIFVMDRALRAKLARRFRPQLKRARVICLDIPDDYGFMDPALVALLEAKVTPFLPQRLARELARGASVRQDPRGPGPTAVKVRPRASRVRTGPGPVASSNAPPAGPGSPTPRDGSAIGG